METDANNNANDSIEFLYLTTSMLSIFIIVIHNLGVDMIIKRKYFLGISLEIIFLIIFVSSFIYYIKELKENIKLRKESMSVGIIVAVSSFGIFLTGCGIYLFNNIRTKTDYIGEIKLWLNGENNYYFSNVNTLSIVLFSGITILLYSLITVIITLVNNSKLHKRKYLKEMSISILNENSGLIRVENKDNMLLRLQDKNKIIELKRNKNSKRY